MARAHSITTARVSPAADRRARETRYLVSMGIRMVCILGLFLVDNWLRWVCLAGAVLLPYFAVLMANIPGASTAQQAELMDPPALPGPEEEPRA
ncbi:DUF3099 domain-containing protein [Serinibacter salmoneus]|uniref:DUF3099 family protein n=1 Tax=Serinibacter salmoneus TaxID=556530 RepID=A0A2A9D0N1_9MICO|nr:DUF3099 domain-containing protein [Serinibacter salmoneus]PFG19815.1 Protein of unknown function (DUF3099) [Serinibacter salmoneus]